MVKSRPKAVNFGTVGSGHPSHIAMELVANRLGLEMTHVPYKGTSPALQGLMGGEVGAAIVSMAEAMPQVRAGNVIAVATSGPAAKEGVPDLPDSRNHIPTWTSRCGSVCSLPRACRQTLWRV